MTREEAIESLKNDSCYECAYGCKSAITCQIVECKYKDAMQMAIEALEQEPCNDAISRQAMLDGLASIAKAKARSDAQKSLMGRVMFFAEHLPSATPQPRWIPVSERLPKGKQEILISLTWDNDIPEVRQGNIDDINYWKHYSHITSIAWMPLPEPYVPDTNDGKSDFNQTSIKHKASFNQVDEDTDTFVLKRNPELMESKVLDEIRAEIDSALSEELPNDIRTQISDVGIGLEIALKIIDKHRKEE